MANSHKFDAVIMVPKRVVIFAQDLKSAERRAWQEVCKEEKKAGGKCSLLAVNRSPIPTELS